MKSAEVGKTLVFSVQLANVIEPLDEKVEEIDSRLEIIEGLKIDDVKTRYEATSDGTKENIPVRYAVPIKQGKLYYFRFVDFDMGNDEILRAQFNFANNTSWSSLERQTKPTGVYEFRIGEHIMLRPTKDYVGFYFNFLSKTIQPKGHKVVVEFYELDENTFSNKIHSTNPLYGKKYVSCGDSFTEGDFNGYVDSQGNVDKNSPEVKDSNDACYMTYPWWIANRNRMILVNEAKSGSTMSVDVNKDRNPFSVNRYKNIPNDADYITIMFGINDRGACVLGTIDDTENTTFYGAWNVVLPYLIEKHPSAKIGVIVENGSFADIGALDWRNAVKEVCKKHGIAVLDLAEGVGVGTTVNKVGIDANIKQKYEELYCVSATNKHPNVQAHLKMSYQIEAFLRSM